MRGRTANEGKNKEENRGKRGLTDESQGAKCLIKVVYATASQLKRFLGTWTATANQGVKISLANTAL